MTKKAWIIFAVICVALIGGLIYMSSMNKVDVAKIDALKIQNATDGNGRIADHTFGNMKSKVILIEYGDYQCPGCGAAYPIIKQVTEKYKDQLGFVFRNYPLSTVHPNALASATVAEEASLQGKFWEMHNKLYETQNSWNQLSGSDRTDYFISLADTVGIDKNKLTSALNGDSSDSNRISKKINFDLALGKKQVVSGTPTLYLNGKEVSSQYFKDGKIVPQSVTGAQPIWSDATVFDTLVIKPVLQDNGMLAK